MESAETFFLTLAQSFADQLDLDAPTPEMFDSSRSAATNFERYMTRVVLPEIEKPVAWGIDEADRLFPCSFRDDVFSKIRSWHNERALKPDGPWARLSFILAISTEASLFIKNINQSPFNVSTPVLLRDLTPDQSRDLNSRYGNAASPDEMVRIHELVNGHPYLVQRVLYALHRRQTTVNDIEAGADRENGLFHDHLDRMHFARLLDHDLTETVRQWLRGEAPPPRSFGRLCAAGVMAGPNPAAMRARCPLYERYLKRQLL